MCIVSSFYTKINLDGTINENRYPTLKKRYKKGNFCEVCGDDHNLVTDHDHYFGDVRGTICGKCNSELLYCMSPAGLWALAYKALDNDNCKKYDYFMDLHDYLKKYTEQILIRRGFSAEQLDQECKELVSIQYSDLIKELERRI